MKPWMRLLPLLFFASSCGLCGEVCVEWEKMTTFENWDKTDQGDFVLTFEPAPKDVAKYEKEMKASLTPLIDHMNESLKLPKDMKIFVTECGEENAFWNPLLWELTFCWEFVRFLEDQAADRGKSKRRAVIAGSIWTMYHEIGHALITSYDILVPARGEEDLSDEFATLALLASGTDGQQIALDAAGSFDTNMSQMEEDIIILTAPFDEHSVDSVRYENMRCWLFGHNPKRFRTLKRGLGARATTCRDELLEIQKEWSGYTEPFLKDGQSLVKP